MTDRPMSLAPRPISLESFFAIGGAILFALVVRFAYQWPPNRSPDERVYMTYALRMSEFGLLDGTQESIRSYVEVPDQCQYPPPYRISMTVPLAVGAELVGDDPDRLTVLFFLTSLLGLAAAAAVSWLLFGRLGFVCCLLLGANSPFDVFVGQRVWADGPIATLSSLSILTLTLAARGRIGPGPAMWIFSTFAALGFGCKEFGILVPTAAFLVTYVFVFRCGVRDFCGRTLRFVSLPLLMLCAEIAIVGGLDNLVSAMRCLAQTTPKLPYILSQHDSSLFEIVSIYWAGAPVLMVFLAMGTLNALHAWRSSKETGSTDRHAVTLLFCVGTVLLILLGHTTTILLMNLRFMSSMYPAILVLATAGIVRCTTYVPDEGPSLARKVLRAALVVCVTAAALATHHATLQRWTSLRLNDLTPRALRLP